MRLALVLLFTALPVAAQKAPPFLTTFTDPTNSHFARESLGREVPKAVQKLVAAPVLAGPEVDSLAAARDFAAREGARYFVFAQCGLVIELLKVCDAHIKYCAHQCEAWVYPVGGGSELGHARVTGEKGGSDAVKKLVAQLEPALAPLREPVRQLLAQQKAEAEARASAERVQRELERAEKARLAAEERARKAQQAARGDEEKRAARAKLAELEASQRARAEEERLRSESQAAAAHLAAEREKRLALERAQASRVIHLQPGQTVAVLEVENDLAGGARNQLNFALLTDNLRKRVAQSGLGLLVMDRDAIFQILSANEKQVLECPANCEVHLGRILRTDYVISGRLGRQGQSFRLYLLMYRSRDGALLSDAVAVSDQLASLDRKAAMASTDLLSVFPVTR